MIECPWALHGTASVLQPSFRTVGVGTPAEASCNRFAAFLEYGRFHGVRGGGGASPAATVFRCCIDGGPSGNSQLAVLFHVGGKEAS